MPDPEPAPADQGRTPFAKFLQEVRGGELHTELSHELAEVVAASSEHGKAGTITLTIKVAPNADGSSLLITDEVKSKPPKAAGPPTLFFADAEGNLSRRDPRQLDISALREVPAPAESDPDGADEREAI